LRSQVNDLNGPSRLRRFWLAWRLSLRVVGLNFQGRMEYRSDFITALLMGLAWQTSVLVFIGVLLVRFPGLGGWDQGSVLLIVAIRMLSHGLVVTVFNSLLWTPHIVQQGLLDGYLVRPLPIYRQVLLFEFPINAIGDLFAAILIFGYAMAKVDVDWTPLKALYLAAAVVGGALVEGAVQTLVAVLAFRFTMGMGLFVWVGNIFATFGNYPMRILPVPARAVLTFVLPVAFVAYLPAAVLTGQAAGIGVPGWLTLASPAVGLVLYVLSRYTWFLALRRYEAVGG
jgi:viologen exporter family transport system permease protein